jgi:hypothetical protein
VSGLAEQFSSGQLEQQPEVTSRVVVLVQLASTVPQLEAESLVWVLGQVQQAWELGC